MGEIHYRGQLAYWYDRLLQNEKRDVAFYLDAVTRKGSNALELACGTGRILLPLARAGIDVDGVDLSADMLAICRQKLAADGLNARLFEQDMSSFHAGRRYNTVLVSGGSFQLLVDYEAVRASLSAIREHLVQGGRFLVDLMQPLDLPRKRSEAEWRELRTADERTERFTAFGREWADPHDSVMHGEYRYELYRDGVLAESWRDEFRLRWYGRTEFLQLLEKAGMTLEHVEPVRMMSSHSRSLYYEAACR